MFKATYRDHNKQKKYSDKWYLEFRNHLEEVHRLPAFTDKRQSETLGRQIEKLVNHRMLGEYPDHELVRLIEGLPKRILNKLIHWQLIDGKQTGGSRTLIEHLSDFKTYLTDKGTTKEYACKLEYRITQILNGIKAVVWTDISYSNVQRFLADKRQAGKMKISTANHYLAAIREFLAWMVMDKRSHANPLELIERLSDATEDKRKRRPFTVEELRKLITTTANGPIVRNIEGKERALIYKFAAETGLRANEIRTLVVSDFDLVEQTVHIKAKNSKNRREATVPLRIDTSYN
jgi:integrase